MATAKRRFIRATGLRQDDKWWRTAITYQVYIRSFTDSDRDGLGDIGGIRARLSYLAALGVDALWINPWYPSPQADGGYDVADYRSIDPAFGDIAQAEALIDECHRFGLRILLDIVPNHTSDEHPWFQAALADGPGSSARKRYIFRPGRGDDGSEPPNDWPAVFGGSAWQRVIEEDGKPGEWYLHLFDVKQPDLNWEHPEVRAEFLDILRFWFDRGVDGMRIDVAHGLFKDPSFPDLGPRREAQPGAPRLSDHPHWDQDGVHDVYRTWRTVADSYSPPRIFVAEAWVASPERLARYLRPDELHAAFDFDFVRAPWNATDLTRAIKESLAACEAVDAPVMWLLSNHDITRHVTRLGRENATAHKSDPLKHDQVPVDLELGRRRARAALMLELALPGGVYLYQGEELGLPEVEDLPEDNLQDPTWERSGHTERGRDGCRVPLPWSAARPGFGFSGTEPWLPQPTDWAVLSATAQAADPSSMLSFYRRAIAQRRHQPALMSPAAGGLKWLDLGPDVVAFRRGEQFTCILNLGTTPQPLPEGVPLLCSAPLEACERGTLCAPVDTAVWLTRTG